MAFTRLMRVYYRDEKPIPSDPKKLYRIVRAQTRKERVAVDSVLGEFFVKQDDGWHNKRCDEEVAAAQAQADINRKIATNRPRLVNGSVNGSHHEPSHASSTNRPPLQYPDSNIQTPLSNIHTHSQSEGGGGKRSRIKTADELEAEELAHAGR